MLLVPTPLGEVVDRWVILEIKVARLSDPARRAAAEGLRDALARAWRHGGLPEPATLPEHPELVAVNGRLWEVEDALRAHEARADFGPDFVSLAREVYRLNDRRAAAKAAVDRRLGSALTEPKSYG